MTRSFASGNRFLCTPAALFLTAMFIIVLSVSRAGAQPQAADDSKDKNLDVRSSIGDLHVGKDADARRAGLPLYPGARLRRDDENSDRVNLGVLTEAFGMKLVVAHYDSDDAPVKVVDFYRAQLKKYGKVVECHTKEHGGDVHADVNDDKNDKDENSKALKCEGDNTGPVTELKVGTENNQHVVAIEPRDSGKGTTFALVYVHTRGKQGEI